MRPRPAPGPAPPPGPASGARRLRRGRVRSTPAVALYVIGMRAALRATCFSGREQQNGGSSEGALRTLAPLETSPAVPGPPWPSLDMEDVEARFAHLLQPIRDLTKNWEVDVAAQLGEYLEEVKTAPGSGVGRAGRRAGRGAGPRAAGRLRGLLVCVPPALGRAGPPARLSFPSSIAASRNHPVLN